MSEMEIIKEKIKTLKHIKAFINLNIKARKEELKEIKVQKE